MTRRDILGPPDALELPSDSHEATANYLYTKSPLRSITITASQLPGRVKVEQFKGAKLCSYTDDTVSAYSPKGFFRLPNRLVFVAAVKEEL